MTLSGSPIIFLSYGLFLGELHDRCPLHVQKLQRNGRLSILGVVLDLPRLFVHADQLHLFFVDHPLIIRYKDESFWFLGYLFEGRASRYLLMEPILVMHVVGEEARLFELAEPNVPHVFTEVDKIKYQMRTRCYLKLHVLNPRTDCSRKPYPVGGQTGT